MYEVDDPRSTMKAKPAAAAPADPYAQPAGPKPGFAAAEYQRFYQRPADESANGAQTWYGRGQNFVVAYSRAEAGAVFERRGQVDEYMLALQYPGKGVRITAGG